LCERCRIIIHTALDRYVQETELQDQYPWDQVMSWKEPPISRPQRWNTTIVHSLDPWKDEFQKEMLAIKRIFSTLYAADHKHFMATNKQDDETKFLQFVISVWRAKILHSVWSALGKPTQTAFGLNSLLVPKRLTEEHEWLKTVTDEVLQQFNIALSLRPAALDQRLPLPEQLPPYIQYDMECYDWVKDMIRRNAERYNINDSVNAQAFVYMFHSDIKVVNEETGQGYMWDSTQRLWLPKTSDGLGSMIQAKGSLILHAATELYEEWKVKADSENSQKNVATAVLQKLAHFKQMIQSTKNIRDMYTLAKLGLYDKNFLMQINRQHDLFPLCNGQTLELKTGVVRPRTRKDMFSFECPVTYVPAPTEAEIKQLHSFVDKIFMENEEYITYMHCKLGSYLSGRCVRTIDIFHGKGKNGKSAWLEALKIIMGEFLGYLNTKAVACPAGMQQRKMVSSHTSHLQPIEGKRLIVTQELENGDVLDAQLIKKIASNDPIEGTREVYGRKTAAIHPFCKLVIATNYIPEFDVNDTALLDRFNLQPFQARFLKLEEKKEEKAKGNYNPNKFRYYDVDAALVQCYTTSGPSMEILFSWLAQGCRMFYTNNYLETGIPKPDIVRSYLLDTLSERDKIGQWLNTQTERISLSEFQKLSSKEERAYWTMRKTAVWDHFSSWASQNECHKGYNKKKFYAHMEELVDKRRDRQGDLYDRIHLLHMMNSDITVEDESMESTTKKRKAIE
jgi:phage/plasmid-associated DNA primase